MGTTAKATTVAALLASLCMGSCDASDPQDAPMTVEHLQRIADRVNAEQRLPREFAPGIRSDATTVGPGIRWNFSYTFLNRDDSPELQNFIDRNLAGPIVSMYCHSDAFSAAMEKNVTIEIRYIDRSGTVLRSQSLTTGFCRKAANNSFKPTPLRGAA